MPMRIALVVVIILAIAFGWFTARWQFGGMLAGLTSSTQPNAKEIAETAKALAPNDPMTSWLLATTGKDIFTPENLAQSLRDTEQAVKLAPYDYRWWVELGRAYEQLEQPEKAETAYLRAVELAPSYTYPHWQLGNFYLRQNRTDVAFAELQKAAVDNDIYRQQVLSIAWEFYEQDVAKIEELAGDSPAAKVGLARFFALKGRSGESLRVWNTVSAEDKEKNDSIARLVARVLYNNLNLRSAVEFVNQIGIEPDAKAETVQNSGFEGKIDDIENVYFGWKIGKTEKVTVKIDPSRRHSGERSLRVAFNNFILPQLSEITQAIATEAGKNYRLTFWVKTDELKSAGPPTLEVVDVKTNAPLASSKPFPTGTNDWQEFAVDFTAPEDAEGIFIRTARSFCGDSCPIIGTIWYDDFELKSQ